MALGPCWGFPWSILAVERVDCCTVPVTKCGNRAAIRGPRQTLEGMSGSSRLKLLAETSGGTAAGRFLPRAAFDGATCEDKVGLAKWI